jgi:hypothetical protein
MSSKLKRETARTNGAKSHGPHTPEGKARSAANSRRHGLAAAAIVLPGESAAHFQLLLADYMDQFQPQTGVEADLIEVMAVARWRLRRLLAMETHLFDVELCRHQKEIDKKFDDMEHEDRLAWVFQNMSDTGNTLALLLRYEASINRSYDKALKQLHQFQSNRPPVPPSVPPADPLGSFGNPKPDAPSNLKPLVAQTSVCVLDPATGGEPPAQPNQSRGIRDAQHRVARRSGAKCTSGTSSSLCSLVALAAKPAEPKVISALPGGTDFSLCSVVARAARPAEPRVISAFPGGTDFSLCPGRKKSGPFPQPRQECATLFSERPPVHP